MLKIIIVFRPRGIMNNVAFSVRWEVEFLPNFELMVT